MRRDWSSDRRDEAIPDRRHSTDDSVTLREYLAALRSADSHRSQERLWWLASVGVIVWFEIQRRLEILNHENARLLSQQERSVSKDTYDANEQQRRQEQADLSVWRKDVDTDRTQAVTRDEFQHDYREQRAGIFQNRTSVVALGLTFVLVVVALLTYIATHHSTVNFHPVTTDTVQFHG